MIWKFPFFRKSSPNPELQRYIRGAFGFHAKDISLFELALRHSSAASKITSSLKNSNERLEFLGDAILDSIIAHYIYLKYPLLPEGELTKMKSKVVRRENLNKIGYSLKVETMLDLKIGNQELHDSLVGNALEALIGAIYLDKGYIVTREIVLRLLKEHGLDSRLHDDVDYKSKLHEWGQKYRRTIDFRVVSHRNEGGASFYKICVVIDGKEYGFGEGASKKSAEQRAAKETWNSLFKD
jgi:ribonuclease III